MGGKKQAATGISLFTPVFSPVKKRLLFMRKSPFFPAAAFLKMMLRATCAVARIIMRLRGVTKIVVVFTVAFFKTAPAFKSFLPVTSVSLSSGMTVRITGSTEGF